MAGDKYAGARVSEAEAKRLMADGAIDNYTVEENGQAVTKRGMDDAGVSWGESTEQGK